jgi:hypothetical protein
VPAADVGLLTGLLEHLPTAFVAAGGPADVPDLDLWGRRATTTRPGRRAAAVGVADAGGGGRAAAHGVVFPGRHGGGAAGVVVLGSCVVTLKVLDPDEAAWLRPLLPDRLGSVLDPVTRRPIS